VCTSSGSTCSSAALRSERIPELRTASNGTGEQRTGDAGHDEAGGDGQHDGQRVQLHRAAEDTVELRAMGGEERLEDVAFERRSLRGCGVLIGEGRVLSAREVDMMSATADLFFLNCCHLAAA